MNLKKKLHRENSGDVKPRSSKEMGPNLCRLFAAKIPLFSLFLNDNGSAKAFKFDTATAPEALARVIILINEDEGTIKDLMAIKALLENCPGDTLSLGMGENLHNWDIFRELPSEFAPMNLIYLEFWDIIETDIETGTLRLTPFGERVADELSKV